MKKKTNKDNSLAWLKQGTEYQGIGDLEGAIEAYTKAIRYDPDLAGLYVMRAYVYGETGRIRQAMRDVNKAIELNPGIPEPYFLRGDLNVEKKKYDEAIADLTTALKLDPKYAEVYCVRAAIYELKGEGTLAMMDYQMAAMVGNKKVQEFLRNQGIGWLVGGTESGSASNN